MIKSKITNSPIPMGRCDVVVYAGRKDRRAIVYRQQVQFDPDILSKGFRGLISRQDLLAYKQKTIDEYVSDVFATIQENVLVNPEIAVVFNCYKDEDTDVNTYDVYTELLHTETETLDIILKQKITKYFGEFNEFYTGTE